MIGLQFCASVHNITFTNILIFFIMTNFNTYDYEFLTKFLAQGSIAFKVQSIKRLTTLAQNDKKQFLVNSKNVLYGLEEMYLQEKQDINILSTFLLSEIILNIISKENQQIIKSKHLKYVIQNLGHISKPQIRKASHTCLLAFIKTYHNFDGLIGEYLDAGFQNDSTLIKQKSINSLQSIFMLEARYFNWKSEQAKRLVQQLTLRINDDNLQIGKASAQCLLSLCRTQGIKITASGLSIGFLQKLKDFLMNTVAKIPNAECHITLSQIDEMMEGQRKKPRQPEIKEEKQQKKEIKVIDMTSQNLNHQRRLQKIKKAIVTEQKKQKQGPQLNFAKIFNSINHEGSLKERTEAAEDLLYKIQVNKSKPQFQGSSKIILPNIIKMMKDPNPKIVGITLRILQSILDDVKTSDSQLANLITVIIQKLGDQKISVRQMVAKVIKELIRKTQKGIWVKELLENMRKNTNTFLKDQTLAIIYGIYDENQIQDVNYPVEELLRKIVVFTDDPKTKVKIRTLDCLSQIVFKSNQVDYYSEILKNQMSDVFYQMFIEKVNKLVQQKQRKIAYELEKNKKKQQINNYRTTYQDKIHRKQTDKDDQKLNVSMDVVKKRVSQLKRHRNIQSTQETSSLDNTQRTIDRNMEDVEIMLPSLYKKTKTNRFELKKKLQSSPSKTIETKASEYLTKQDLKPLNEPEKQLKTILSDLKNSDWKMQFQVTNTLRRLIQFHPQIILSASGTNLHVIVLDLLGLIESLRSSVSKNALICLNELILAIGKQIDPEMQIILQKLMKKSVDTNVFISSEVQKCLRTLSTHATPSKVIDKLSIYKESKNFAIKDAFINTLIIMKNEEKIRSKQYAKLTQIMAYFLNQGQQDLRTKAKSGLIDICKSLGDWYRLLRGKINSSSFKLICDLMTKAPSMMNTVNTVQDEISTPLRTGLKRKNYTSELKTINVETKIKERMQSSRGQGKSAQKKSFVKVSQFPQQFNQMQSYIDISSSSEWKKRMEATQSLKKLALQYPNQFIQYRSSCHFMDILSKQMVQPNLKVSVNAMEIFLQLHEPLRSLIESNLSVLSTSIFNSLSSNKVEVKDMAQKCTSVLTSSVEIPLILPHLCHGILYALPKSRIVLVNKLQDLIGAIYKQRKQLLFKHVFPVLNKLMDEYRAQLMPHVVNLFVHMYDIMGNNMFSHVTKFKEVRELIAK